MNLMDLPPGRGHRHACCSNCAALITALTRHSADKLLPNNAIAFAGASLALIMGQRQDFMDAC